MVWSNSATIYEEHFTKFKQLCEENDLRLDSEKPLLEYFNENWQSIVEDWVYYFRLSLPTFGTNTNNHLESFNRNLKISVNHHLHLTNSIKEVLKVRSY
jgi:hypothetical protein